MVARTSWERRFSSGHTPNPPQAALILFRRAWASLRGMPFAGPVASSVPFRKRRSQGWLGNPWTAATCCRFPKASLLAVLHGPEAISSRPMLPSSKAHAPKERRASRRRTNDPRPSAPPPSSPPRRLEARRSLSLSPSPPLPVPPPGSQSPATASLIPHPFCVSAALRETPPPQKSVAATTLSQASTSRTLAAAGAGPDPDWSRNTFVLAPGRFFPILPALQNRLRPPDP